MNIGGQAVIEGVMIRNKEKLAIAVRLPSGKIKIKKMRTTYFPAFFNVFLIRGIVGLGFTLYDGLKGLLWSSNQQLEKEEKLTKKEIIMGLGGSFFFAILFFVALPFFSAYLLHSEGVLFNVLDGVFRIALFLGYLAIVSRMEDVKRLFAYHGAEHKAIYCHESGKELTVKNALSFSRFHPRCGTSFLFLVLLVSIVMFSLIEGPWWVKLSGRILLLPIISGISYELIKLTARFQNNFLLRWLVAPGMWLQRLTTKEPSKRQLEVGIAAVKAVLD
ncbi:DUF1385 domain-containing protein [Candidatus Woesearchaeota archaeon]|nr:DUF1385 domain-containing protein [Candidatus Woesearchaeota archaeon]